LCFVPGVCAYRDKKVVGDVLAFFMRPLNRGIPRYNIKAETNN
jgi:hypothetical protein